MKKIATKVRSTSGIVYTLFQPVEEIQMLEKIDNQRTIMVKLDNDTFELFNNKIESIIYVKSYE